jgi:hypothetical protein
MCGREPRIVKESEWFGAVDRLCLCGGSDAFDRSTYRLDNSWMDTEQRAFFFFFRPFSFFFVRTRRSPPMPRRENARAANN